MDVFVLMQADIAYESISDALKPPTTERNYVYSTRLNEVIGPFHAEARLLKHDKKDPQKTLEHIENMRKKIPELRKAVNHLRQECKPIASGQDGYFYAQTAGKVYATIRNLKKMRAGLDAAIQGLEQALDNFPAGR